MRPGRAGASSAALAAALAIAAVARPASGQEASRQAAAASAGGRRESLRFDWPELACPDRQSVVDSLGNLDLVARDSLGDEEPLPQAAAVDPAWVEARRVAPAGPEAAQADAPLSLELLMHTRGRTLGRVVALAGACAERAAVVAAIVERVLRPAPGTAAAETASGAEPQEFEVTLAPQGDPSAAPPRAAPEEAPGAAVAVDREPLWILNGALVVLGGEGPTFRGGADAEVRYEFSWDLFAVVRLSYRSPRVHRVGPATVRVDDAWAALGLQVGSPKDPIALQATAIVQLAWSHGDGLQKEYNVVSANPGVTVGACYQKSFETWGFEGCVRGFGFLRRQEIHVNESPVLGMPRVGGELAIGIIYQI